ncbi:MAG: anthranilate phosphoribosyltransferase [Candidatus Polarisedimenticolia bacterium]
MSTVAGVLDILARRSLTRDEAERAFDRFLAGGWSDVGLSSVLGALKARGETAEEIAGAALALRRAARGFPRPDYRFADTCGTGGDGAGTLNVSTAAAIVAAAMGIPIAKHGNRAASSRCGSADVLEHLGVRIDAAPEVARRCLDETGLCFLFAPSYHEAVKRAMPVRRELGTRTLFNLLGPLVNPARPVVQMVGVPDPSLCHPVAGALALLGATAALVVHGDGLDEVALHGPTRAVAWRNGRMTEMTLTPEEAGLASRPVDDLRGGDAPDNAAALRAVVEGREDGPFRDAACLNAGALAWVWGMASNLGEGTRMARETIASGRAALCLKRCVEASHGA